MGLLLIDTRDHFSVTNIELSKNEHRNPQLQVKSDSAHGESIYPAWNIQPPAHQGALKSALYNTETNRLLSDLAAS